MKPAAGEIEEASAAGWDLPTRKLAESSACRACTVASAHRTCQHAASSPSGKEMGRVRAAMPASLRLLHNAVHHEPAHAG